MWTDKTKRRLVVVLVIVGMSFVALVAVGKKELAGEIISFFAMTIVFAIIVAIPAIWAAIVLGGYDVD